MSPLDNTHCIPAAAPQAPFAARHIGLNAQDIKKNADACWRKVG